MSPRCTAAPVTATAGTALGVGVGVLGRVQADAITARTRMLDCMARRECGNRDRKEIMTNAPSRYRPACGIPQDLTVDARQMLQGRPESAAQQRDRERP